MTKIGPHGLPRTSRKVGRPKGQAKKISDAEKVRRVVAEKGLDCPAATLVNILKTRGVQPNDALAA
jgi:hypothetical protein